MDDGALHDTSAEVLPGVALTPVGAPRTVLGVTAADGAEAALGPAPLLATTVKVYGVPLVKPVTVQLNGPLLQAHVLLPGLEVAV